MDFTDEKKRKIKRKEKNISKYKFRRYKKKDQN